MSFDIEANVLTEGPFLQHPYERVDHGPFFNDLRVHPREDRALIGAKPVGGNQESVAVLDLETGHLQVLRDPFFDPESQQFQTVDTSWRWRDRPLPTPVRLHADLAGTVQLSTYLPPPTTSESVAQDMHDLTITLVKAFVDHADDPHRLRPEALRCYEGHRRYAPQPDAGLAEWLDLLVSRNVTIMAAMPSDSSLWDNEMHAFAAFAEGLARVHSDRSHEIDWRNDRNA